MGDSRRGVGTRSKMAKILVVEDDQELGPRLQQWLKFEKYTVELVQDGAEAMDLLAQFEFDLIVLDLGLPGLSGLTVLKQFRGRGGSTPVLILTGKGAVQEKEQGLDAGGDDYLTKPFDIRELSARIRALLRRAPKFTGSILKIGQIELDMSAHKVKVSGEEVALAPREFALLEFLMRHAGQVINTETLLERVWATDSTASSETIYTCVKSVRKKMASTGKDSFLRTVHGIGYTIDKQP